MTKALRKAEVLSCSCGGGGEFLPKDGGPSQPSPGPHPHCPRNPPRPLISAPLMCMPHSLRRVRSLQFRVPWGITLQEACPQTVSAWHGSPQPESPSQAAPGPWAVGMQVGCTGGERVRHRWRKSPSHSQRSVCPSSGRRYSPAVRGPQFSSQPRPFPVRPVQTLRGRAQSSPQVLCTHILACRTGVLSYCAGVLASAV